MKRMTGLVLVLLSVSVFAQSSPSLEKVRIGRLYAPRGFDTNDRIQVEVVGMLENTCHFIGPAEVFKTGNHVEITQYAYHYSGTKDFCIQMQIPYKNTVEIGVLDKDDEYEFVDGTSKSGFGKLKVDDATTPNPDEFTYAPIEDASIERNSATGRWEVRLKVAFRNRCTKLKEVRIDKQDDRDTILVRPIADGMGIAATASCPDEEVRFTHAEPLPAGTKGVWLLHVRSVGTALHRLSVLQ